MCKIEKFQWNFSTIFIKLLNIYMFSKIFQKVKILMLRWNILQYLKKMLREYFICNERLEIFLICFCNIQCYVGRIFFFFTFSRTTRCFCLFRQFRKNNNVYATRRSVAMNIFIYIRYLAKNICSKCSIFCTRNFLFLIACRKIWSIGSRCNMYVARNCEI